ncbi:MAG: hypothetical protein ACAI34_12045 [Verrucomicrobium sp.]|nr:hypothetical protein [Verrucomicrobium sp.]
MKASSRSILTALAVALVLTGASCSYKYYLPRSQRELSTVAQVTMKVGERRKVLSEQPFNGIQMNEATPVMVMFSSSNPEVVDVDLKASTGAEAWIIAKKAGQSTLVYRGEPDAPVMQTVVKVLP